MSGMVILGGFVSAALLVYLVAALLQPVEIYQVLVPALTG